MNHDRYTDRRHAGVELARQLAGRFAEDPRIVVLALPRGGVPVAAEVSRTLGAPLDVVVVRKIGVPSHPEVAMGAIAGIAGTLQVVTNTDVLSDMLRFSTDNDTSAFDRVAEREKVELLRRQQAYRGDRPPLDVTGRSVLLVDDGLATGASMRAAIAAVREQQPARVIVAVPVGPRDTCDELKAIVDEVVCSWIPEPFWAVGQAYLDFGQTSDAEVQQILERESGER